MNRAIKLLVCVALLCMTFSGRSQNLKGIWTGGLAKDTSGVRVINPSYVLNIKEQADDVIRGKAYVIEKKFGLEGVLEFIGVIRDAEVTIKELRILSSKTPYDTLWLCIKTLKMSLSPQYDKMTGNWTGHIEMMNSCTPARAYLSRYVAGGPVRLPNEIMRDIATDPGPSTFMGTQLSDPKAIVVANRTVTISLLDYQRVDNDTVTVYLNRETVVRKLGISLKPYIKEIKLNKELGMNEVIVMANNLGKIPPNTCTMVVDDGVRKQSVNIVTTKQVSAAIYLRYEPALAAKESGN